MILSKFPSYCTRLSNMIKNLQFLNTYCEVFLQISLALLLSHLYSCVYFSRFTTTGIWLPVFPCPVLYVLLLPVCEMPYSFGLFELKSFNKSETHSCVYLPNLSWQKTLRQMRTQGFRWVWSIFHHPRSCYKKTTAAFLYVCLYRKPS